MSFLTAALTAYGGYGRGKQQNFEDTLEKRRQDSQDKIDAANAQLTQQQITAGAAANAQTATNRQFESGLKLPPNWSKMSPQDQYNYLSVRYTAAQHAGDTQATADTLAQMNSLPRAGYEFANTQVADARVGLIQAQAAAERDLPARARDIARGHDQNQWNIASARIANSQSLAQYNYGVRWNLAQLAGAYRFQTTNDQDATRMAIAYYNGQVQAYKTQMNPEQALLNPGYQDPSGEPGPPQVGSTTNVYVQPGGFNGPPPPVGQPPPVGKPGTVPAYRGQSLDPQTGLPYPATQPIQRLAPMKVLTDAKQKLQQGWTPARIDAGLQQLVKSGALDPRAATQIEIQLGLKTAAGGSLLVP